MSENWDPPTSSSWIRGPRPAPNNRPTRNWPRPATPSYLPVSPRGRGPYMLSPTRTSMAPPAGGRHDAAHSRRAAVGVSRLIHSRRPSCWDWDPELIDRGAGERGAALSGRLHRPGSGAPSPSGFHAAAARTARHCQVITSSAELVNSLPPSHAHSLPTAALGAGPVLRCLTDARARRFWASSGLVPCLPPQQKTSPLSCLLLHRCHTEIPQPVRFFPSQGDCRG